MRLPAAWRMAWIRRRSCSGSICRLRARASIWAGSEGRSSFWMTRCRARRLSTILLPLRSKMMPRGAGVVRVFTAWEKARRCISRRMPSCTQP